MAPCVAAVAIAGLAVAVLAAIGLIRSVFVLAGGCYKFAAAAYSFVVRPT